MKIKIWQIDENNKDAVRYLFLNYDWVLKHGGFRPDLYKQVYEGELNAADIEDVYYILNVRKPADYKARSLSVSDVVEIDHENAASEFAFCDSIGFLKVNFKK